MSAATPAPIWWCIAHKTTGDYLACVAPWHPLFDPDVDGDCEMVQRRLVSGSALVVERDAAGEWPTWAIRAIENDLRERTRIHESIERAAPGGMVGAPWLQTRFILDALAAARREAST